ncbi:hypothetical protein [Streptomyces scopuliridis]|uniref:hypothetical protein n=1 Tax=Streptomyces scopuliridis TaxID=452529 RepID=UPI003686C343
MTDISHPRYVKPDGGDDWWRDDDTRTEDEASGCCATCPIASGCALSSPSYVTCPITGSAPPPAPPARIPAQHSPEGTGQDATGTGTDWTEIAGRGVETAVSAAFGFGWLDIATGLVERLNREDSEGNPVDWGRLQLKRNGLAILVATLVPLGEHTAAQWVAHALREYNIGAAFVPAGMALGAVMPVFVGRFAPGVLGSLCRGLWGVVTVTGRAAWSFLTSRLGWIVTRPAIWAAVCGLLIVSGRFLIHVLTGA